MGDAAGDHVADAERGGRRYRHMGVLVIEMADRASRLDRLRRRVKDRAEPQLGDRHVGVVGDVAPAHGQDRLPRFRPRLHIGPDLDRGLEAITVRLDRAAAILEPREVAPVHGRVVAQIAAAAGQHHGLAAEVEAAEAVHHHVVERRPAGRQDDRTGPEQILMRAGGGDGGEEVQERRHLALPLGGGVSGDQALEALDAAERQLRCRGLDRARHFERAGQVAAAGATAADAALQKHVQRARDRALSRRLGQHRHPVGGIDQAVELERRVAPDLVQHEPDGLPTDQLIGQHDALEAEMPAHLHLLHGGHGDRPGPVGELAAEQLRAHGGLAVGRDGGARATQEPGHPAPVMGECRVLQHRHRKRQVLGQQVPALGPDVAQAEGCYAARNALLPPVDDQLVDLAQPRHPVSSGSHAPAN